MIEKSRGRARERNLALYSVAAAHNNPQLIVWQINLATLLLTPCALLELGRMGGWSGLIYGCFHSFGFEIVERGSSFLLFTQPNATTVVTTVSKMKRPAEKLCTVVVSFWYISTFVGVQESLYITPVEYQCSHKQQTPIQLLEYQI